MKAKIVGFWGRRYLVIEEMGGVVIQIGSDGVQVVSDLTLKFIPHHLRTLLGEVDISSDMTDKISRFIYAENELSSLVSFFGGLLNERRSELSIDPEWLKLTECLHPNAEWEKNGWGICFECKRAIVRNGDEITAVGDVDDEGYLIRTYDKK